MGLKLKKFIIIGAILLIFCVGAVYSQHPNYKLIIIPNEMDTNPGEIITLSVYISGSGYVKRNKINFFLPPNLFDEEHIGTGYSNIGCEDNGTGKKPIFFEKYNPLNATDLTNIMGASLVDCSFWFQEKVDYHFMEPFITSEQNSTLDWVFNISKNAHPGDYVLRFVFTYTEDGLDYYQDEEQVKIHVNNWEERNRSWSVIIYALITALAFFILPGLWKLNRRLLKDFNSLQEIFVYGMLLVIIVLFLDAVLNLGLSLLVKFLLLCLEIFYGVIIFWINKNKEKPRDKKISDFIDVM